MNTSRRASSERAGLGHRRHAERGGRPALHEVPGIAAVVSPLVEVGHVRLHEVMDDEPLRGPAARRAREQRVVERYRRDRRGAVEHPLRSAAPVDPDRPIGRRPTRHEQLAAIGGEPRIAQGLPTLRGDRRRRQHGRIDRPLHDQAVALGDREVRISADRVVLAAVSEDHAWRLRERGDGSDRRQMIGASGGASAGRGAASTGLVSSIPNTLLHAPPSKHVKATRHRTAPGYPQIRTGRWRAPDRRFRGTPRTARPA